MVMSLPAWCSQVVLAKLWAGSGLLSSRKDD